jgi:hypothetical protein
VCKKKRRNSFRKSPSHYGGIWVYDVAHRTKSPKHVDLAMTKRLSPTQIYGSSQNLFIGNAVLVKPSTGIILCGIAHKDKTAHWPKGLYQIPALWYYRPGRGSEYSI